MRSPSPRAGCFVSFGVLLSALLAPVAAADDGAGRFYASVSGLYIVANDTESETRDDFGTDTADISGLIYLTTVPRYPIRIDTGWTWAVYPYRERSREHGESTGQGVP